MAQHSVTTSFLGGMAFQSDIDAHKVIMDTNAEHGGNNLGPSPKKMLLAGLAGCTGMDVVSLLEKMRVEFSDLNINVEADLTEDHPKVYSDIRILYSMKADEANREKIEKAIRLSEEKYCGVSAMLSKNSPVHFKLDLRPL